jgi:peptidoglycan LD-endopeptidase LytH
MDKRWLIAAVFVGILAGVVFFIYGMMKPTFGRSARVVDWIKDPAAHPDWVVRAGTRCLLDAPFVLPTDGLIGYLWNDSFQAGKRHQGIDIFGGTQVGTTPVVAAYPGYLSRLPGWKSAVIVRVPNDPLQTGRQIWLYYTHMADPNGHSFISSDFPPGMSEKYVEAGTLLGYQGNYTGDPANPSGVHLHFSVVLSDVNGHFLNELDIRNTLDPSPYLGLPLNAATSDGNVIICGK